MIVDDEIDILDSLKTVFEKHDYNVTTVDNGYDCIEIIEKGFKGVVLMDLMMPEIDGWDTIHEIVNRGLIKNVAIEIITGKGTKNYQRLGTLGSYIYDYFPKPLDINQLINSVEKCYRYLKAKNN